MPVAGIALGSNLEPRLEYMRAAFSHLCQLHHGKAPPLASPIYETAPVNCPSGSPSFLNAVVEIETDLEPKGLLTALLACERTMGRVRSGVRNEERCIDMDLLYIDQVVLNSEELILPHPRISVRNFVVRPLANIRPDFRLPGNQSCMSDLDDSLGISSGIMITRFSLSPEL